VGMNDLDPVAPHKSLELMRALHVESISQRQGKNPIGRQVQVSR